MILIPGELMGLHPEVLGSFVSHGVLDPEHGFISCAHWSVMVDAGEPHGVFLVPMKVNKRPKYGFIFLSVALFSVCLMNSVNHTDERSFK